MYIKLQIPPGVFRNGTEYQAGGRWHAANLVRWSEGAMQPVGGWTKIRDQNDAVLDTTNPVRGMLAWRSNAQAAYLALGTKDNAYSWADGGSLIDITPDGFTTGDAGASPATGQYGVGTYGDGFYGVGTGGGTGLVTEANSWQFDNFGEILLGVAYSDGLLYSWDLNPANNLTLISANAPTQCRGVVVTPERFVVALCADGDGRRIAWADQESLTTWAPTATNQAGAFILPGTGEIMCGQRMPNETLIFTDADTFALRYIGGLLVYTVKQVGSNTGIISRRAKCAVDGRVYWMGHRGFYTYEGGARSIPCSISDAIFTDLNDLEASRIAAWPVSEHNEIWFAYPSAGSSENDRVVTYNYMEQHWSGPWNLERTDGVDRDAFRDVIAADAQGAVYYHERGDTYLDTDDATALVPSAESGPYELGQGDQVMTVRRYIPDENTAGDVDLKLLTRLYPTAPESETTVTVGSLSDVRVTGRQVRLKIEQDQTGWRFGIPRLEVTPRGRR